jgi:hypothetical protein
MALALVVASPAFAQIGEPGDMGPDGARPAVRQAHQPRVEGPVLSKVEGPLHIEDLLCPLSPRGIGGCITQGFHAEHRGIDISLRGGTPISATHAGTVTCGRWVGGHFGGPIQTEAVFRVQRRAGRCVVSSLRQTTTGTPRLSSNSPAPSMAPLLRQDHRPRWEAAAGVLGERQPSPRSRSERYSPGPGAGEWVQSSGSRRPGASFQVGCGAER